MATTINAKISHLPGISIKTNYEVVRLLNVAVYFIVNQRFREISKDTSIGSNCSKLRFSQDLFEMFKKRDDFKKSRVFGNLATDTQK